MNNNHDGKFSIGFLMGLLLGGGVVFLLGTRTGKNILKIISEQGLDGVLNLLEEYNFSDLEEFEEVESEESDFAEATSDKSEGQDKEESDEAPKSPKKRFFKRVRK
jgi:hypothetical protein